MTGPKISSWATVESLLTFVSSVGSTYQPCSRSRGDAAAERHRGALVDRRLDVAQHAVAVRFGDQRADDRVGGVRIAHLERLEHLDGPRHDLVVLRSRRQDPAHARAVLALRGAGAEGDDHRDGGVEVGVLEDDRRRLAAELEHAALDLRTADLADLLADLGGAGERDHVDVRVGDQVLGRLARGGDDVDHAGREPGLGDQVGHREQRQRVRVRGLDHGRAAGHDRRRDLLGDARQREVERGTAPPPRRPARAPAGSCSRTS